MGIDANGFFIIAVIARIIGGEQTTGANPKALGVGRREGAASMHRTQGQSMVVVHNLSTGGCQRLFSYKVMQNMT